MIFSGNPQAEFIAYIAQCGLKPPQHIIEGGDKPQRFQADSTHKDKSGWYIFHSDGIPAGVFGDWRDGAPATTWRMDVGRKIGEEELRAHQAKVEAMISARNAAQALAQDEAADKAQALWAGADAAPDSSHYLVRKGIKAHGTKVRYYDGALLVPMSDMEGKLRNIEQISEDGFKWGLKDGQRTGLSFMLGRHTVGVESYLCEGFSTGCSIHEATGKHVIVAFNAGNLVAVARALRKAHPDVSIAVCGDDDRNNKINAGAMKASEAASAVGGRLVLPDFGGSDDKATDFNDLHKLKGLDEVRKQVEVQVEEGKGPLWPNVMRLPPTDEFIENARLTPKCFVQDYLYADVGTIIAPGGTGKTTLLLHEAACLALGRTVWGNKTQTPGWTLLITGEDQYERLIARLREICAGMDLTQNETRLVFDSVLIHDVSSVDGHGLTKLMDGNIIQTEFASIIIDGCRHKPGLASIVIDPMISFGASEAMVNDNEQKLVDAARIIVAALECCVRYVHHSGKALERVEGGSQYAGRGGSAMPDGCRMVTVLAAHGTENGNGRKETPPPGCKTGPGISLTILHRSKQSYSPPNLPKIWISREGHMYEHFLAFQVSPDQQIIQHEKQIATFLGSQAKQDRFHTWRTLEDLLDVLNMTRAQLRAARGSCEASGLVFLVPAPKSLWRGRRKEILATEEILAMLETTAS